MPRASFVTALSVHLPGLLLLLGASPAAHAGGPFDAAPLTAAPADLRKAADAVKAPEDADTYTLLADVRTSIDAQGLFTQRAHRVVVILDPDGVRDEAVLQVGYDAWHQAKPTVKARVIDASGAVHALDPTAMSEATPGGDGKDIYSDRRVVQAPLPAVAKGAIIETWSEVVDTKPAFAAGASRSQFLAEAAPVGLFRVSVDADAKLPLRHALRGDFGGKAPEVKVSKGKGRKVLRVERQDVPAFRYFEPLAPPTVVQIPMLSFSTAASWQDVAKAYHAVVEQQLTDGADDLKAKVAELTAGAKGREAIAQAVLGYIRDNLRYTGVELGEAALVPRSPATTLKRRFGDCKDLSTLMVGMLRQAGVEAHVALLDSGFGRDVPETLPGMGPFDHAIVVVAGKEPLWIDPTAAWFPVGTLPAGDTSRRALIAAPTTKALTTTPRASAVRARQQREITVRFEPKGHQTIAQKTTTYGTWDGSYRTTVGGMEEADYQKGLSGWMKRRYDSEKEATVTHVDARKVDVPYTYEATIPEAEIGWDSGRTAYVYVSQADTLWEMPDPLTGELPEGDEPAAKRARDRWVARKHPLWLPLPHRMDHTWIIEPPPGYRVRTVPEAKSFQAGPTSWKRTASLDAQGRLTVRFEFDSGPGELSPADAKLFHEKAREVVGGHKLRVDLDLIAAVDLERKRFKKAIASLRELADKHPERPMYAVQLVEGLVDVGLGGTAVSEAERLVKARPKQALIWGSLGYARARDGIGRYATPVFNRGGAIEAFRKAVELDEEYQWARAQLAFALQIDDDGKLFGEGADLEGALQQFEHLLTKDEERGHLDDHLALLLRLEKYDRLVEAARDEHGKSKHHDKIVAATAMLKGTEAAFAVAREAGGAQARMQAIANAVVLLMRHGKFVQSGALARQLTREVPGFEQVADMLEKANFERPDWKGGCRFFLDALQIYGRGDRKRYDKTLAKRYRSASDFDKANELLGGVVGEDQGMHLTREEMAKMTLAGIRVCSQTEDVAGKVVKLQMVNGATLALFLVTEKGRDFFVGAQSWAVGVEMHRALKAGKTELARAWAARAQERLNSGSFSGSVIEVVLPAYAKRRQPLTDEELPLAAAAFLLDAPKDAKPAAKLHKKAIATLEDALAKEKGVERRIVLGSVLGLRLMVSKRWKKARAVAKTLMAAPETYAAGFRLLVDTEVASKSAAAAEKLCAAHVDHAEVGLRARIILGQLLAARGEFGRERELYEALESRDDVDITFRNNNAWNSLFDGRGAQHALEHLEPHLSRIKSDAAMHTVATLYAEVGKLGEAHEWLVKAAQTRKDGVASHDFYISGRIAEHLGLKDEAKRYYTSVDKPKNPARDRTDTWHLAQARLAALAKP